MFHPSKGSPMAASRTSSLIRDLSRDRYPLLLLVILFPRILVIFLMSIFGYRINVYAQQDARRFERTAESIADGFLTLTWQPEAVHAVDLAWGFMLSPFWLLPGPSILYARIGVALLGAFAIYNVYVIARYYHSHKAGLIAIVPLAFFPSIILIHSAILREAAVLFCITTIARVFVERDIRSSSGYSGLVLLLLLPVWFLRQEVVIVIIFGIAVGFTLYLIINTELLPTRRLLPFSLGVVAVGIASFADYVVGTLSDLRARRTRGRTVYLADVIPSTLPEMVAFSWIGAAYFLFAPFPWMIENTADVVVGIEGSVNFLLVALAVVGVRKVRGREQVRLTTLVVVFLVASILFGLGTGNYGTAVRHRPMVLWIPYIFAGMVISDRVQIRV